MVLRTSEVTRHEKALKPNSVTLTWAMLTLASLPGCRAS